MIKPGLINLDFADIRAVMGEMGKAMMGTGEASGESRATQAAESAINNPLLDDTTMKGAYAVLINITGGMDMTLFEVDEAANRIRKEVDADATIIFGSAFDDKLEGVMRVSVVATGINTATQIHGKPVVKGEPQAVPNLQGSPIVQNPLADLTPNQSINANTPVVENTLLAVEPSTSSNPSKTASTDSPAAVSTADLATAISDQEKNAKDEDISDNANQLDIDEAIAKSAAENGLSKTVSQQCDSLPPTNVEHNTSKSDGQTIVIGGADKASENERIQRSSFIPAQTTTLPDADSVPEAKKTPATRPNSLINKISGLWSTKPDAAEQVLRLEPAINEPQTSASILDLSKSTSAKTDDIGTETVSRDASDEELDIPAFLRRQAN
jgi:cell division protein FtsZ